MEKISIAIFLLLILFGSNSCEDSFSQVVEVDLPPHTPLISVNGIFEEPNLGSVLVADSKGILEDRQFNILSDATVIVSTGASQWSGIFEEQTQLFYFFESIDFENVNSLGLTIEAPGYESVSAEAIVPDRVEISNVVWKDDGGIDLDGYVSDLISVEFDDPAGENFYSLEAFFKQTFEYVDESGDSIVQEFENNVYLYSNDPLLYSTGDALLFSDASFNGKKAQIEALGDVYNQPDSISVVLNSLSRDAFLYERSLSTFQDNDGNPFAEPVTVHSNIEGGYGIFAATRRSEKKIELVFE